MAEWKAGGTHPSTYIIFVLAGSDWYNYFEIQEFISRLVKFQRKAWKANCGQFQSISALSSALATHALPTPRPLTASHARAPCRQLTESG